MISFNTLIYVYLKEDCEMNEFDERLIDFRANRSQFSTDRPVFLRELLLAYRYLKQFLFAQHVSRLRTR